MININKKNTIKTILIFVSIFQFVIFPRTSFATTEVYFENENKMVEVGQTFTTNLKITSDKNINVIDGTITFNKDNLKIKDIKIDKSLLSLWVEEPVFDNEKGELILSGAITDGFIGKDGQIVEITFVAKKSGTSLIGYKDIFSVYKNDGKGTIINPWLKPLSLTINKKPGIFANLNVINYIKNNFLFSAGIIVSLIIIFTSLFKIKKIK